VNWDDLKFLISLIENKTASAAAKKLNVNYVTVCRRIERLEHSLKQKLIYFKDNQYYPTNEGEALYQKALDINLSLSDLEEKIVSGGHLKQTITISSSVSIGEDIIIPNLNGFYKKYPQIKVDFLLSPNLESVIKKECDIAIRFLDDNSTDGEFLASIKYHICSSKFYLQNTQEDKIIIYNFELKHLIENRVLLNRYGRESVFMEVNSLNAIHAAIINGMAIGILPEYLITDSVRIIEPRVMTKNLYLCASTRMSKITSGKIVIDEIKNIFSKFNKSGLTGLSRY